MKPVIRILFPLLLGPLAVLQAADGFKPAGKPNSTFISAAKHDMKTRIGALDAPGGLIVHVRSRNLDETVALRNGGAFLVHVLYADPAESERADARIAEKSLSGKVTVSSRRIGTAFDRQRGQSADRGRGIRTVDGRDGTSRYPVAMPGVTKVL